MFLYLMMAVQPNQDDPKFKYSHMSCRARVKGPLDENGIYAKIDNQIMNTPHDILVHLASLEESLKTDIGTLNKYRGGVF